MMPGGHLVTAVGLSAGAYLATRSSAIAAGVFAGGFLIDLDHYLDYLLFERQWRRPQPAAFLRYSFRGEARRLVLPLHSIELMAILTVIAVAGRSPIFAGYLIGAAMHLIFDIIINGDYAIRQPVLFYFFTYRAVHQFDAKRLLEIALRPGSGSQPFRQFFRWRPLTERRRSLQLKSGSRVKIRG